MKVIYYKIWRDLWHNKDLANAALKLKVEIDSGIEV